MNLVIRSNYSDDSIALLYFLFHKIQAKTLPIAFEQIWVVYIQTGWSSLFWQERVKKGTHFVQDLGFKTLSLYSKKTFAELVKERKSFPSPKFQWCASFLKGLPFLEWLDEVDASAEWIVALPKRQAAYRVILNEWQECPYHGERTIWHPILQMSDEDKAKAVEQAGFCAYRGKSQECAPCIHDQMSFINTLSDSDKLKVSQLEQAIGQKMFPLYWEGDAPARKARDVFSRGCGDYFGCGL